MYIIIVTHSASLCLGDADDWRQTPFRCQAPVPARARLSEPAARSGKRPAVSRGGFLRPARPGPGQVRDAAPGAARGAAGQPGIGYVRFFSPGVLSGAICLRAGRIAGTGAEEARAARRAQ